VGKKRRRTEEMEVEDNRRVSVGGVLFHALVQKRGTSALFTKMGQKRKEGMEWNRRVCYW
jgi:hypothetical protein